MRTDDPGTPGSENWEINIGYTIDRRAGVHEYELPILDINYGLGNRIQLKYELPWVVNSTSGTHGRAGLGNSLAGVKWRFLDDEKRGFAISTYPQLEFNNPTHSVKRGLVDGGKAFLLPIEAAKEFKRFSLTAEVGHWFSRSDPGWIAGLAAGRQATKRLEVLGEVYVTRRNADDREKTFGFGGRARLTNSMQFIFMAGRSLSSSSSVQPSFVGYVGLQVLLNDAWEPEDHPGETRRP